MGLGPRAVAPWAQASSQAVISRCLRNVLVSPDSGADYAIGGLSVQRWILPGIDEIDVRYVG